MHGLFSLGGALVLTLQLQAAAQPAPPKQLALEGVGRAAIAIAFLHDSKSPMDPKVKSDLEAGLGRSVADSLTGAHFQIAPTNQGQTLTMSGGKLTPLFTFRQTHSHDFDIVVGHTQLPDGTIINFTVHHSDEQTGKVQAGDVTGFFIMPATAQRPAASVYFYQPLLFQAP